jgi:hypothetical protein
MPASDSKLHGLVLDFATKKCQDPRDKIYGLQGLVDAEDRIIVDYAKSSQQVFVDLCNKHQSNLAKHRNQIDIPAVQRELSRQWEALWKLSECMDFTTSQKHNLRRMLDDRREVQMRAVGVHPSPSILVGYDEADTVSNSAQRWWYATDDEKHHYKCS